MDVSVCARPSAAVRARRPPLTLSQEPAHLRLCVPERNAAPRRVRLFLPVPICRCDRRESAVSVVTRSALGAPGRSDCGRVARSGLSDADDASARTRPTPSLATRPGRRCPLWPARRSVDRLGEMSEAGPPDRNATRGQLAMGLTICVARRVRTPPTGGRERDTL